MEDLMMKGVLLPGNKKVVIDEFPIPVPKDDEVFIHNSTLSDIS